MKRSLADFATRLQIVLEGVKTEQSRLLVAAIDQMIQEGLKALSGYDPTSASAGQLERLIAKARRVQSATMRKALGQFQDDLHQLSLWQQGTEASFLQKGLVDESFLIVQLGRKEMRERILAATMQATGERLEPFLQGWSERQIDALWKQVYISVARGDTIAQITKRIQGTAARRFKDGHAATSRRHAETVARTAVQHVSTATRIELFSENDHVVQGYIYIATLDDVTTRVCQSLDQQKFKVGKGPVPPMHPNCRSTIIPDVGKMFDFLDEGATRSSENGPVSAKLSYYDWLKKQPKDTQDRALGATLGEIFRSPKMTPTKFRSMQLDKNFKPIKVSEIQKQTGFVTGP